ncbi:MAG: prevent-host-death protein [Deltaproteobacteria bacterium]|nr:prevent-host-death protein [Deltaproteobacteria bacterium]
MKYMNTRDFRNTPGRAWDMSKEDDIVLTANGKPVALLVGVDESNVEETAQLLRNVRAQMALHRLRAQAQKASTANMSEEEINQEIANVRRQRAK